MKCEVSTILGGINMYPVINSLYILVRQKEEPYIYKAFSEVGENYNVSQSEREIINKTACEILELCNGTNSEENIIKHMMNKYDEEYERVQGLVHTFLNQAMMKNYISLQLTNIQRPIIVRGSYETMTPIIAVCELTKKCPLKCIHCLNNSGKRGYVELSTEQWKNIFKDLHELGVQKINLTGGEVFSRNDFLEILDYCCSHFIAVAINSNGFYIDENTAKILKKYKNNIVFQISLDGNKENHNKIRGNAESFDRAINAIKYLVKYKVSVSVAMTCNKYNIDDVEFVTKLVKTLGANQINISRTIEEGRAKNRHLSENVEIEKILDVIRKMRNKYADKFFFVADPDDKMPYIESGRDKICGAGKMMVCIHENGDISPCLSMPYILGNVIMEKMKDIFMYDRWKVFSDLNRPSSVYCSGCTNEMICLGCNATAMEQERENCNWKNELKTQIEQIKALPRYSN